MTKEQSWDAQKSEIHLLQQLGAKGVLSAADLATTFTSEQTSLTCGDEGIPEGVHAPGSGVLLSDELFEQLLWDSRVTTLTSHAGCGAFAVAHPEIPAKQRDLACRKHGEERARRYGLAHRYITAEEMQRPKDFHNAVTVYYDGTSMFKRTKELPPGFVVSRLFSPAPRDDLKLYINIALGEHGFGERFTASTPFYVIILAHPHKKHASLKDLTTEVRSTIADFGPRVVVGGLKVPWFCVDRLR